MAGKTRREQIEEMLKEDADDDGFLRYCLGMEHLSASHEEQALECFVALLKAKPDYVPAYLQLGQLLNRRGDDEEAKIIFRQGIAVAQQKGDQHAAGEMTNFLAALE
jgi:Tfp pilus assembly protein PilF